ncbi:LAS seventeen-binding protein 3, partial [Smittium mucronatum]
KYIDHLPAYEGGNPNWFPPEKVNQRSADGAAAPQTSSQPQPQPQTQQQAQPQQPPLDKKCGEAVFDFTGESDHDLAFKKGDIIQIIKSTDSQFDWWEGSLNGKTGQFPANYIKLIHFLTLSIPHPIYLFVAFTGGANSTRSSSPPP